MHRIFLLALITAITSAAEPLRVCATVPDLGDLARAVGGDDVQVTVFARGGDDPHFVDPRPSFAKSLARADLVVSVGLQLEIGWLPVVVTQSRNPRLAPGQPAWFEAATAVTVLDRPVGEVDRSHGDVHPGGNPHFLSDPVRGVQVAHALAERFGELAPACKAACTARYRSFAMAVAIRLLGASAVRRAGDEAIITALEHDTVESVIGDGADLGGWLGAARPLHGIAVVADHDLWPYLAKRLGFRVCAYLEPLPGIPPTTAHLVDVISVAGGSGAKLIVSSPYFDPRHARFVSEHTGLPVVILAHQAGSLEDAPDWLEAIDHNVHALTAVVKAP